MQLILASSSVYRKTLLDRLGLPFSCASPNIDESALSDESANALSQRLALSKAMVLIEQYSNAWIIGSDQVCQCNGVLLGKPGTLSKAREQLQHCSGQIAEFHTSLVLLNTNTRKYEITCDLFSVRFRNLSDAEIDYYLQQENPVDCAGSFKAEGLGIGLFSETTGSDFHSLLGLPLLSLCQLLRNAGLNPLQPNASLAG